MAGRGWNMARIGEYPSCTQPLQALSLEASSLNVSVHSAATVVSWQLAQGSSLIDATSATMQVWAPP